MRLLLTGNRGRVGPGLEAGLVAHGHDVVGFDRADGGDVLDPAALRAAARGCAAAVHLAAISSDRRAAPDEVVRTNVVGTWNLLCAAEAEAMERVVVMSSVNALGIFLGQGRPERLPIDDDHPARPRGAYGTSKLLCEQLCRSWSAASGIPSVCLRPPAMLLASDYETLIRDTGH